MFREKEFYGSKLVNVTPSGLPIVVHVGVCDDGKSAHMTESERLPVHQVFSEFRVARTAVREALRASRAVDASRAIRMEAENAKGEYEVAVRRVGQAIKGVVSSLLNEARDLHAVPERELDVVLLQLLEENGGASYEASVRSIKEKGEREEFATNFLVGPITGLDK